MTAILLNITHSIKKERKKIHVTLRIRILHLATFVFGLLFSNFKFPRVSWFAFAIRKKKKKFMRISHSMFLLNNMRP